MVAKKEKRWKNLMGIGLIILGILILLLSFFTPIGIGQALLISIILIIMGLILFRKRKQ